MNRSPDLASNRRASGTVLPLEQVFGLWGDHLVDGLDYQRRIRAEWDRDWDPD